MKKTLFIVANKAGAVKRITEEIVIRPIHPNESVSKGPRHLFAGHVGFETTKSGKVLVWPDGTDVRRLDAADVAAIETLNEAIEGLQRQRSALYLTAFLNGTPATLADASNHKPDPS